MKGAVGHHARREATGVAVRPASTAASLMQNDLGFALARGGRVDEATQHLAEAIRLGPDLAGAHKRNPSSTPARRLLDQISKSPTIR